MDAWESGILAALLQQQSAVALCTDQSRRIVAVHNQELLSTWLEQSPDPDAALDDVSQILRHLFAPTLVTTLLRQLETPAVAGYEVHDVGTYPVQASAHGALTRQLAVSTHALDVGDATQMILLRDVTMVHALQNAVLQAQAAADTAMALLRGAPDTVRLFLDAAMASVAALRATLRMSARTSDALHDKLVRLHEGAGQLGVEAQQLQLASIHAACNTFCGTVAQLQLNPDISGNDLLPLPPLLDGIAHAIGNAWRSEEQRFSENSPSALAGRSRDGTPRRKHANWPQASNRRWNQFLRRHGEELGILAKLTMEGAEIVPVSIRRDIDDILQHLLRNALEHGIETPEQRLVANKPAAGQISVSFETRRPGDLRIVIRDDGRGFDLQRIGQAAVKCGLVTEEALLERSAADLVGIIFKPGFTTEGLSGEGHGRGMIFLRNAVTRLNGQVSVATKAGRYTQFKLHLPVGAALQETRAPTYG
jgi:two-component system, chemotaxis family, sensor kinase CheA